jgi:hypothetical protein
MIQLSTAISAGTTNKLTQCADCTKGWTAKDPAVHCCDFRYDGFPWHQGAGQARPCGVAYFALFRLLGDCSDC